MAVKKFRTPKLSCENIVSFTCSNGAMESVLNLLEHMHSMGELGCSRDIVIKGWGNKNEDAIIDFDGDGQARVDNISINGMSKIEWEKEWKRLDDNEKEFSKFLK